MTINEISKQLEELSVGNYFNHTKMNKGWVKNYLNTIFYRTGVDTKQAVFEIALPDGWWTVFVTHYGNGRGDFDYTIPETREDEAKMFNKFYNSTK